MSPAIEAVKCSRAGVCAEAIRILKKSAPHLPVIANLSGPFSIATSVIDPLLYYRAMRLDMAATHRLTRHCTDVRRGKKKEVGTWFMTPGWAEIGAEIVIKELHLERARKYGKDPMALAKRLFTHYRRGLYIDTGVGDNDYFLEKVAQFCKDFDLVLEKSAAGSIILDEELARCRCIKI
jgi:hypothetical protein